MLTGDAIRLGIHPSQVKKKIDTADDSEGVEAVIDLDDLKFNELRKLAKQRGLKVPIGTRKTELVKLLKGE